MAGPGKSVCQRNSHPGRVKGEPSLKGQVLCFCMHTELEKAMVRPDDFLSLNDAVVLNESEYGNLQGYMLLLQYQRSIAIIFITLKMQSINGTLW